MTEGKQITPLSKYEQETVILYNQAEQTADVYTHDPKLLEKLKRLTEKYPKQVQQKEEHCFVVPKRCVSIREPYSEERRQAASRRAKEAGYIPPRRNCGKLQRGLRAESGTCLRVINTGNISRLCPVFRAIRSTILC